MTNEEILNLPMQRNDADADTIRDYLKALLRLVWVENEGFNGKRPFGNSGWEREIAETLVINNLANGNITIYDGFTEVDNIDWKSVDEIVLRLIDSL